MISHGNTTSPFPKVPKDQGTFSSRRFVILISTFHFVKAETETRRDEPTITYLVVERGRLYFSKLAATKSSISHALEHDTDTLSVERW